MNYLNGKFSVFAPDSEEYRSNWDRIFGPKTPTPLWKSLDDNRRERLFDIMRDLSDAALDYFNRGREDSFAIPVGAAFFDDVLKGAAREELVSALRIAPTLEIAEQKASEALRVWVCKHNARRPNDVNWQRWIEAGQDELQRLVERVRGAIS